MNKGSRLAPEFPDGLAWLNTPDNKPLTMHGLLGRVVLMDFWTYSCVNCLRTLPHIKRWYERYHSLGLEIVGVHTPEFGFEREQEHVERAVKQLGIHYPVVLDSQFKVWSAWNNNVWPRKFLVNTNGTVVADQRGEGGYAPMESAIQELLQSTSRSPLTLPRIPDMHKGDPRSGSAVCYPATPELYLGYQRGEHSNGNARGLRPISGESYHDNGRHDLNRWYLDGQWTAEPAYIQHARENRTFRDYLAVRYQGLAVNLVAGKAKHTNIKLKITLDNKPLTLKNRGEDVEIDKESGNSYVTISAPRMYNLVSSTIFHEGELRIYTHSPDLQAYALTFGSCAGTRI